MFERTEGREGDRLTAEAFPLKQMKKGEVSVARVPYTTAPDFDTHVVTRLEPTLGKLLGVACVSAAEVRAITFDAAPAGQGSGICVLDRVVPGDHDGHAALQFSAAFDRLTISQIRMGKLRKLVLLDLADKFRPISPPNTVFRPA